MIKNSTLNRYYSNYSVLNLLKQKMNRHFYSNNDLRKKIEDYSYGLKDIIGKGFSSVVYKGINEKSRQQVAIKVIDIKSIQGKPQKKMLEGEIDALKKLNHPNILKCHDIYSTANNCYIITEFCNEGDLETLIKKRSKLPQQEAIPIIRDFLQGFKHFGEAGFLHRDLKPANLLIKDKITKIADFGFAKRVTANSKEAVNVGSPLYMSPQALNSNIYTIKNDIWSVGVIIYEILHGKVPWSCSTQDQLKIEINKNNISLLKNLSQDLKDFIRKCLAVDQNKRFSLHQFVKHPFFTRICQNGVPQLLKKATSANENNIDQVRSEKCLLKNISTDEDVQKNKIKQIHHRNNAFSPLSTQKQLHCQINWMRFLYKLNELFPKINDSGRSTLNLRFVICKQLFSQLNSLKSGFEGQNILLIDGWKQFLSQKDQSTKYIKILDDYTNKYTKNKKDFEEWIEYVQKDRKMNSIADNNLARSENLSIMGVSLALDEIRGIWKKLQQKVPTFTEEELPSPWKQQLLRLDFITTYYQLNCLLLDNFNNPEYFAKHSKLEHITEYKPVQLGLSSIKDVENKLKLLEIIR